MSAFLLFSFTSAYETKRKVTAYDQLENTYLVVEALYRNQNT
jgi:hypothetical protein